jgi:hypothetical protein
MNRTKKLLMGVTASALITGATGEINQAASAGLTFIQTQPDPAVDNAVNIIRDLLYGVSEQDALTLDQLRAKRPELKRDAAEKAIKILYDAGSIRRTGDGTRYKPFRFYDKVRSGGHGG